MSFIVNKFKNFLHIYKFQLIEAIRSNYSWSPYTSLSYYYISMS